MKAKIIYLAAVIAICNTVSAYAESSKSISSKLNDVTLFFHGAELTHSASASLTKGENEITIEGLSSTIDKSSLKIKASNGVVISSYEFSVNYLTRENVSPAVKKLQDSIDICQKQLQKITSDIKINNELIGLLQDGTKKNVSGTEKGMTFDELVKAMNYYKTKSAELEELSVSLNEKKTKSEAQLSRLKKQMQQEAAKNNKVSGILKIALTAPATTSCNFEISYYTTAAAWEPYYDINIESTDKPVKLVSKAKIAQITGIDWEKVKITLSTATPTNGKIAPIFNTWFLNYQEPVVMRSMALAKNTYSYAKAEEAETKDVEIMEDAAEDGVAAIPVESTLFDDYISMNDNQMNITYAIDLPYSIPGNGKEQNLDLRSQDIKANYKYYSVPKLDNETYLLAEIENAETLNLLNGKANITYEGTYVGETPIDASSTMENLSLTLGTDKRVSVKREKMQDYSSKKTLGGTITQVFAYRITVKNNQNKTIKMTVKDQYPISTQKDIEIELLKNTTNPTFNKQDTGVLTWEDEFKAGETKTYIISYSVKYPKDKKLNL